MKKHKGDLDVEVAAETGELLSDVSTVTGAFLRRLADAIANGEVVRLRGFGQFRLAEQGGGLPPHAQFGTGNKAGGSTSTSKRFRVHFTKAEPLKQEIHRRQTEKHMEKYGVDETTDQEALIKAAADGCPACGAKCERHGNTLKCPVHGTAPFEKKQE